MILSDRIKKLREQSLNAVETISAERAELVTRFYRSDGAREISPPVRRAKAFEYILRHKTICINDGELIVGERGPAPKSVPTYPEICVHSIPDLEILDTRQKVSFRVSGEVKKVSREEIIPFWQGKSNRDRIMGLMTPGWLDAYNAGIFTEFLEQRAPGHTVAGYKVFSTGFSQLRKEIDDGLAGLDFINDRDAFAKSEELKGMGIACDAIIMYAGRHAGELERLALPERDEVRKAELLEMARICRKVPAEAPETVHEMLQHYWFIHLGVITELNPWDSFSPGRLDQHLDREFKKERENGSLSDEKLFDLLGCFWIKFNNHPTPPKIDHLMTGGTLLNQKFTPQFFGGEDSFHCLTALIRSYFSLDGHHIQFNVVDAATLRDAQRHPELYRDLIVRVAGYSDYFNNLGDDLQNEIIMRTEHGDA